MSIRTTHLIKASLRVAALDLESGEYRWHYQQVPGEEWDYTCTQSIIQAELTIDGRERKVLLHAPKNGFFYVLDRATGELISAENFAPVNWASHIDLETGRTPRPLSCLFIFPTR